MQTVPSDVVIHRGQVRFGMGQKGSQGEMAVILPQFDVRKGCSMKGVQKIMDRINTTPRLRKDGDCESMLRKELGDMDTRVLMQDGNIVPLDQEAATMLRDMKLPMKKERHYIPIK